MDHRQQPASWTAAFVGRPYVLGTGECCHRAAEVWRERFGLEVEVMAAHGDLHLAHRMIKARLAGAEWERAASPREGDAVIMRKGALVCHVGVWVAPAHVLHCSRVHGTVLTPVEALPDLGFHLVGCFRRAAAHAGMALAA